MKSRVQWSYGERFIQIWKSVTYGTIFKTATNGWQDQLVHKMSHVSCGQTGPTLEEVQPVLGIPIKWFQP